jgi:hypothetical protein
MQDDLNDALRCITAQSLGAEQIDLAVCQEIKKDELEALHAIFGQDVEDSGEGFFRIYIQAGAAPSDVQLEFSLPLSYPLGSPPLYSVVSCGKRGWLPKLNAVLHRTCQEHSSTGMPFVHDMVLAVADCIRNGEAQPAIPASIVPRLPVLEAGDWREECCTDERILIEHLDPVDFVGSPLSVLKHLRDRCSMNFPCLKVENVVRADLAHRFLRRRHELRAQMERWGEVRMAFHGSPDDRVGSIVQKGLLVGGEGIGVRCGASYGKGVYTSPSADFSLSYSSGKLLVCAVLLGAPRMTSRSGGLDKKQPKGKGGTFHSNLSGATPEGSSEWVLHDAAQVLPCYVLHLQTAGYGRGGADPRALPLPAVGTARAPAAGGAGASGAGDGAVLSRQEKEGMKTDLLGRAAKHFAVSGGGIMWGGKRMVVEDVADSDDDDDLTSYEAQQYMRAEEAAGGYGKYRCCSRDADAASAEFEHSCHQQSPAHLGQPAHSFKYQLPRVPLLNVRDCVAYKQPTRQLL